MNLVLGSSSKLAETFLFNRNQAEILGSFFCMRCHKFLDAAYIHSFVHNLIEHVLNNISLCLQSYHLCSFYSHVQMSEEICKVEILQCWMGLDCTFWKCRKKGMS
jgi:hypothetical protein